MFETLMGRGLQNKQNIMQSKFSGQILPDQSMYKAERVSARQSSAPMPSSSILDDLIRHVKKLLGLDKESE